MVEWAGGRAFEDVLVSARAGEDEAFAELWRWLHPPLLRWLTVVAPSDAQDIESESWLSIARGLDAFRGGDSDFRGWAFTIARRRAVDAARRRRRQPSTETLESVDVPDTVEWTTSFVDSTDALDAAIALLRRLTADQREVLALRVIVGLSTAETSAIVGKSEGAVRVIAHRALRALAHQLDTAAIAGGIVT